MTDIIALTERFVDDIEWQMVPEDLTVDDCVPFILNGIRDWYVWKGAAMQYSDSLLIRNEERETIMWNADFHIDEEQWIICDAAIRFYQKVQSDVNELESYTTDAMAVANADKPYKNLADMILNLKERRLELWHKMPRYNQLGVS